MLEKALENLINIDKVALLFFMIAAFITYGARFITVRIMKISSHKVFKITTILKIVGLFIGLLGLFRITK
ncbi:MAG: hypothetical protein GX160_09310 [Clostridiales bacterium]|jgi:hypothetical protein|nr:hypothetical protein [Clostridiales bacterium]